MLLGVIADDLTGATDIAGFLANNGLDTIQVLGPPDPQTQIDCEAAVVSLKSRSNPASEAIAMSLDALNWLRANNCMQTYFKYCSTFDSTSQGNIGPVTDALMNALETNLTVICPSLPVNGRTVKNGILLVNGTPLAETGMRHHPVTPMTDSNLITLMEMQAKGKADLVELETVQAGSDAVKKRLSDLRDNSIRYTVLDATTDKDLDVLADALDDIPLLTGGSGLGGARARAMVNRGRASGKGAAMGRPPGGKVAVLSGSCSEMTNKQVESYVASETPAIKVDVGRCLDNPEEYATELATWMDRHSGGSLAPLVYATVGKDELREIQKRFGAEKASLAIEEMFGLLATKLDGRGFDHIIVAGGETSGATALALGAKMFRIGPEIAPGVPWIRSLERPLSMVLKSGNFGDERFFFKAQELIG